MIWVISQTSELNRDSKTDMTYRLTSYCYFKERYFGIMQSNLSEIFLIKSVKEYKP